MNRVSPDLIEATDVARLAAMHGEDQCTVAMWMLTMAVRTMVIMGGADATVEALDAVIVRLRGAYPGPMTPKPTHQGGRA